MSSLDPVIRGTLCKFKSVGAISIPGQSLIQIRIRNRFSARIYRLCGFIGATLLISQAPAKSPIPPPGFSEAKPLAAQLTAYPLEANLSYTVRDVETGEIVFSHNGLKAVVPASTQKLFTTFAALEKFGSEHRFTTRLLTTGEIAEGRLKGYLIIEGGGDPAFASSHFGAAYASDGIFKAWADSLKNQGVREVAGCVIADATYLDQPGPSPSALWEDIGNYYGGIVSGLSYHDNSYHLDFSGAEKPGLKVGIRGTRPRHTGITHFENRIRTSSPRSGDSAYIFGSFLAPSRLLQGTYPAGRKRFSIKGSLPHPDWTAARELQTFLAARGIRFTPGPDGETFCPENPRPFSGPLPRGKTRVVAEHRSPPFHDLIKHVNRKSDNNYAEQLLVLMGKHDGGRGTFKEGLHSLRAALAKAGMSMQRMRLNDGSGLSRHNWLSADDFTLFLTYAAKRPLFPVFRASMLDAGKNCRLEAFYGPGWEGRLHAKTGTLEGVYALAGYLEAGSGRQLAFALFVNQFESPRSHLNGITGELLLRTRNTF